MTTEAVKKAHIQTRKDGIKIIEATSTSEKDLLNRCVVGKFQQSSSEGPQMIDVRRWACDTWKTESGVHVYTMNDGLFLFELSSWKIAERIMRGEWIWKKMKLYLEWWRPTTGCWPAEIRRELVWIRILAHPLSL